MSKSADPFDPANLRLPEDYLASRSNGEKTPEATKDYERIKWYRFPSSVLNAVLTAGDSRTNYHAVLAVLMALFELWYVSGRWDGRHRNPVRLSSAYLQRFGVSRHQKIRALRVLEKAGVISVEYRGLKQSPWVTLRWEPLGS